MKRTSFCTGWEFSRNGADYEPVVVPHDAMLGERRDADAPAGSASGYYYGGTYRYRKRFDVGAREVGDVMLLEFEGVYRNSLIHVNGQAVETPPYGFIPFFIDITELVQAGENVIEVLADNSDQPDCRWYSGAGIHRPVWLWKAGDVRVLPEGIRVATTSIDPATVHVSVQHTGGAPVITICDMQGNALATHEGSEADIVLPDAELWSADHPQLYFCEVKLYEEPGNADPQESSQRPGAKHSSASRGERLLVDYARTKFGIRLLEWSPKGLFVNGEETLLRGGCIHCDSGILGAASFLESEFRRIARLKAAGFNAVRVAHCPAPTALLKACDVLGMYVMDETWDMWYTPKSTYDYSNEFLDWCDYDLSRLASRDFNHPSVIMYSIGNEVADAIDAYGVELERSLVELLHSLDPTRPVTCGLNLAMMMMENMGHGWYEQADGIAEAANSGDTPRSSLLFNLTAQATGSSMTLLANTPGVDALVSPALDALDIAGYNYASARYAIDARKHPDRIVVGSETFPYELPKNWELVEQLPNLIGDFMWAAWDYLGEAGAGAWVYTAEEAGFSKPWPWLLAGSGALDIFGRPGAPAALAGAVWRTANAPSIHVRPVNCASGRTYKATWRGTDAIPSWSWADCEGTPSEVEVYDGRAHSIRLELNGEEIATKRVRDFVCKFSLAYQPGTLTARALDEHGEEIGQSSLASATGPFHVVIRPERKSVPAGRVAYLAIDIRGENGVVESNADEQLHVTVEGAKLLAFGSAQPAPTESFLTGTYTTYRGRSMAVVLRDEPGSATVTVQSATMDDTSISIDFD